MKTRTEATFENVKWRSKVCDSNAYFAFSYSDKQNKK